MFNKVSNIQEFVEKHGSLLREHDFYLSVEAPTDDYYMAYFIEDVNKYLVILKDNLKETMQIKMKSFIDSLQKAIEEQRYDVSD